MTKSRQVYLEKAWQRYSSLIQTLAEEIPIDSSKFLSTPKKKHNKNSLLIAFIYLAAYSGNLSEQHEDTS